MLREFPQSLNITRFILLISRLKQEFVNWRRNGLLCGLLSRSNGFTWTLVL